MKFDVLNLGYVDYQKVYDFQKELAEKRSEGIIDDTIILVEHPTVITVGRKGSRSNILASEKTLYSKRIKVLEIDRGGDVTLHCPGQMVCYPIFDLRLYGRDIHKYLRNLEEVIIRLLGDFNVEAERIIGYTGVWAGGEKIASIGVGVKSWVTFHGFSLNVNPSLEHFSLINLCGMKDRRMTSLKKILGKDIEMGKIYPGLSSHFDEVFQ